MAISQQVIYELGLKDKLSGGIINAQGAVDKLEHSIGKTIAAGVALFAGFEFLKGSVEMFNEASQASAQLNATMVSTGNLAKLNREALDKQAESIMNASLFDDDEVTRAQSILATFTNIRGEIFMNTIPAIADLSSKMGTDLKSSTLQVAKAMNDLSGHGLMMLKKSGVDFSKSQQDLIKHLFATNRVAEAQTMILQELNKEFGGSSAAAAEAGTGPFVVLQHQFQNVREEIGRMIMELGIKLMPYLRSFVAWTKDAVQWVREHAKTIKNLALALGTAWIAFKVISGAQVILAALTAVFATTGTAAAGAVGGVEAFGVAVGAALGPIGILAAALGGLVLLYNQVADAQDLQAQAQKDADKTAHSAARERMEYYMSLGRNKETGKRADGTDDNTLFAGGKSVYGKITNAQNDLRISKQMFDEWITKRIDDERAIINDDSKSDKDREFAKKLQGIFITEKFDALNMTDKDIPSLIPKPKDKAKKEPGYDVPGEKIKATKATGSRAVTINVSIKELIGVNNLNATTIKQGLDNIHDAVVGVMSSSVNDFQVIANGAGG